MLVLALCLVDISKQLFDEFVKLHAANISCYNIVMCKVKYMWQHCCWVEYTRGLAVTGSMTYCTHSLNLHLNVWCSTLWCVTQAAHLCVMLVLLRFAWVVDDAKCIVVTRVCVSVCLSVCMSVCINREFVTSAKKTKRMLTNFPKLKKFVQNSLNARV